MGRGDAGGGWGRGGAVGKDDAWDAAEAEQGASPSTAPASCTFSAAGRCGMNAGSKSSLLFSVCDRRVSLFWGAARVPLAPQLAVVPPEEASHSSWSCAACRSPSAGQRDEFVGAAFPSAGEVQGKGWFTPRAHLSKRGLGPGVWVREKDGH